MKAKFSSAWIAVKAFVKKNAFSCACFLLAALVFVTGSVSYAKYVTSSSGGGGASAGTFTAEGSIDDVSALSFTNTAFWGTSASGENVPMNALRSVNFSVRNYTPTASGEQIVASTRLKYNLAFSAPTNFAEKLAFQVFNQSGSAMMPQIVVADLISAAEDKTTYNTASSVDYNASEHDDVTFGTSKTDTTYVATATGITIRLEKYTKAVEQSLMFRLWDTSSVTNAEMPSLSSEGGQLQAPLTVTYTENVEYYRIIITLDDFVLPAGTATEVKHSVRLAPVDSLEDNHVGSTFVQDTTNHTPITSIYGGTEEDGTTYKDWYLQSVWENVTDTFADNSTQTSKNNVSNVIDYQVGNVYNSSTSTNEPKNQTTGEQAAETTTTYEYEAGNYESQIVENIYIKDNYKNKENITDDDGNTAEFICVAVRENNQWGTPFYIYRVPVTRTDTTTVTKTEVTTQVLSQTVTDVKTDVEEEKTITEVSTVNGADNVTMTVERTTKVSNMGTQTVKTITTTTTFTSTYYEEGYVYRAYYDRTGVGFSIYGVTDEETDTDTLVPGIENENSTLSGKYEADTSQKGVSYTVEDITASGQNYTLTFDDEPAATEGTTTTTTTTESFVETTSTTEKYTREIVRTYVYTPIQLSAVVWQKEGTDGTMENVTYTEESPLEFYENGIQKYYLAQCYSKEYPFFVDVVFEQVLK